MAARGLAPSRERSGRILDNSAISIRASWLAHAPLAGSRFQHFIVPHAAGRAIRLADIGQRRLGPGVLLGVSQQLGAHFSPAYQVLGGNILFLAVLAVRPQGLFGKRTQM